MNKEASSIRIVTGQTVVDDLPVNHENQLVVPEFGCKDRERTDAKEVKMI